jgi:UrcA family protein
MKESAARAGILATAILAIGLPAVGSASISSATREEVQLSVNFADLDLSAPAGVERLYVRLKSAVYRACGPTSLLTAGSLDAAVNNKTCARELLDRAVKKVDNAALSIRHSG